MRHEGQYMMATNSYVLGRVDVRSCDPARICFVIGHAGDNYLGRWLDSSSEETVCFPKVTTRELTTEEMEHYNGAVYGDTSRNVRHRVIFPGFGVSQAAMVVKTLKSVYHFGEADEDGLRTISRSPDPIPDGVTHGTIVFLTLHQSMIWRPAGGGEDQKTSVITAIK